VSDFAIGYDRWSRWILGALGTGPRWSRVTVDACRTLVRMGYGFSSAVDRVAVRSISMWNGRVWSRGVHGWRRKWLVNGSSHGIVVLSIDPPARARMLGLPIRVSELAISLEDPAGFADAVGLAILATLPSGFQLRW
jgi:hypothetical protein